VKGACVLDASAAAAVLFREPEAMVVAPHLFRYAAIRVPQLFTLEVANVARTKVLRHELAWESARTLLKEVDGWPMEEVVVRWSVAWALAAEHRLTLYDAAYLALAFQRRLPLLTLDRALQRAAGGRSLL